MSIFDLFKKDHSEAPESPLLDVKVTMGAFQLFRETYGVMLFTKYDKVSKRLDISDARLHLMAGKVCIAERDVSDEDIFEKLFNGCLDIDQKLSANQVKDIPRIACVQEVFKMFDGETIDLDTINYVGDKQIHTAIDDSYSAKISYRLNADDITGPVVSNDIPIERASLESIPLSDVSHYDFNIKNLLTCSPEAGSETEKVIERCCENGYLKPYKGNDCYQVDTAFYVDDERLVLLNTV